MASRPELVKKVKAKLARYCSVAERSPRQLREKLVNSGLSPSEQEQIEEELAKDNFLNVDRFAKAFVHDKLRFNKWGRNRIRLELKGHKIPTEVVDQALCTIDDSLYNSILNELARKKWDSLEAKETEALLRKKKTLNYVLNKGFEMSLAFDVLDSLMSRTRH